MDIYTQGHNLLYVGILQTVY